MKKTDSTPTKKSIRAFLARFPFYPVFFGLYPVLALTAYNITQIDLFLAYRSIIVSAFFVLALFGLLRLVLRDWARAALLAAVLCLVFFSYGHVFALLEDKTFLGMAIGRHRYLLLVSAVLVGLGVWISTRKRISLTALTLPLNIVSALLLFFPIYRILQVQIENRPRFPAAQTASDAGDGGSAADRPDIYYIILDAYGRADVLQAMFDQDNSAFVQALTDRGFYVAACSQSNYAYTLPSLGSSLNLDYLAPSANPQHSYVYALTQSTVARKFLESQGYTSIAFETGFRWTQWEDADVYVSYPTSFSALNSFEFTYLQTTLVRLPLPQIMAAGWVKSPDSLHYDAINYELDRLKHPSALAGSPKFVFAHLIVPHFPYIYGPDGELAPEPSDDAGRVTGYRNAVRFINGKILEVIDAILADSQTPPVIVIQGDHGPFLYSTPHEHMKILNAYYLPGAGSASLYPSISPVNTFRLIFDTYFGQHYPLLEDASWFSPPEDRWNFESVPTGCGN
jgi:hypothetical protein